MTHPFHPLLGREYEFVALRRAWDEDRVYYRDEGGCVHSIPTRWTSEAAADPFVVLADGRCPLRLVDLLALAELLDARRKP